MPGRERETLVLLCIGLTNRQIARQMGIQEQGARNYMLKVMRKTHTKTRIELAVFAFYHGMVDCPCKAGEAAHETT